MKQLFYAVFVNKRLFIIEMQGFLPRRKNYISTDM